MLEPSKSANSVKNSGSNIWYYADLIKMSSGVTELPPINVTQSDVATLLYSSGTTGKSKGVILTHRNLISTSLTTTADQDQNGKENNVFLCFAPMSHVLGLCVVTYSQLRRGNTVVLMKKFDLEKAMAAAEKFNVTHMFVAVPVMIQIGKHRDVVEKYDLSSLKQIVGGAAPLGKDVMQEYAKVLPHVEILQIIWKQGYGMTEACGLIALEHPNEGVYLSGSVRLLLASIESRIISLEISKPLAPNQLGEIRLQGPTMMTSWRCLLCFLYYLSTKLSPRV